MTQKSENIQAADYGRPSDIEDWTNKNLIHPISERVVRMGMALKISPNTVSVMGLACGLASALFYFYLPNTIFVMFGFIGMVLWHIFDGADGKLARATGKASAFGRIIDGICDHLVFGAVYCALALHMTVNGYDASVWWLVGFAALSHAVQSAGYEERRQKFDRRVRGESRADINEKLLNIDGSPSVLAGLYNKAQILAGGGDTALDQALKEARNGKVNKEAVISIINKTAPLVRLWGLLNANNRTIMIAVFAFFNEPILYFVYEATLLNIMLIGLVFYERLVEKHLADELIKPKLV